MGTTLADTVCTSQEAVSGSIRVVPSCDKGQIQFTISYGDVCCSRIIPFRRGGAEKYDKRYHPSHASQMQMNAEEVPTGHRWMLTQIHMQPKICVEPAPLVGG